MTRVIEQTNRRSNMTAVLFSAVVICWWVLDRITKVWADQVSPGEILISNVFGLFDFQLVHNTGAAWGIFGNATQVLGVFSMAVVVAVTAVFLVWGRHRATLFETGSIALIVAGGAGNGVDRLLGGYVVDFINCRFIDFPVFNVADIGVTCGVICLLIALFWGRKDETEQRSEARK